MQIAPYTLNLLNRWEIFQMIADVLAFAEQKAENMPESFLNKLSELRTIFDVYDEEIIVQERRPSSKRLVEADEERDYAIGAMYRVMHAYTRYKFSPDKETASRALLRIMKSFGSARDISRLSLNSKSAKITNLLQELSTDVAQQHIATLNLTDAMSALETSDQMFDKEDQIQKSLRASYVTGVVQKVRLDLQRVFMELVELINALAVVEGQEKYAKLKRVIGSIVRKYVGNAKLRTRKRDVES